MQEARNVVSSPRWQNPTDAVSVQQTGSDDAAAASETVNVPGGNDTTSTHAAAETNSSRPADIEGEKVEATTSSGDNDATADQSHPYLPVSSGDTPSVFNKPMLGFLAACAVGYATWTYTTLEETRARLAAAITEKASIEQSLNEARSKLAVMEKAVADVKAAVTAAAATPAATAKAVK